MQLSSFDRVLPGVKRKTSFIYILFRFGLLGAICSKSAELYQPCSSTDLGVPTVAQHVRILQ